MKHVVTILIAIVAFAAGRYSVRDNSQLLPSLPVAFVQKTQPVALTINVELQEQDAAHSAKQGAHQLKGLATYQFTNLTDETVSVAFPPTRTFHVSSTSFSRYSQSCPGPLSKQQVIDIPANRSISLTGPWSNTVTGNLQSYLQAGAAGGFTFSSDNDQTCFTGTLIAFQTFKGVKPRNQFHTIGRHLELLTSTNTR